MPQQWNINKVEHVFCLSQYVSHTNTYRVISTLRSGDRGYISSQVGAGSLSPETEQQRSGRQAMDLSGPLSCQETLRLSTDVPAGGLHSIKHCSTVR